MSCIEMKIKINHNKTHSGMDVGWVGGMGARGPGSYLPGFAPSESWKFYSNYLAGASGSRHL